MMSAPSGQGSLVLPPILVTGLLMGAGYLSGSLLGAIWVLPLEAYLPGFPVHMLRHMTLVAVVAPCIWKLKAIGSWTIWKPSGTIWKLQAP